MLKISYGSRHQSRIQLAQFLDVSKKINPSYKVIDVGGLTDGWSKPYADMVVDINAHPSESTMSFDINIESEWDEVLEKTRHEGLYDFAVCTHTLEDVHNPMTALKILPKIAKAGVITTPSIKAELSRTESNHWIGNIHHRWMFGEIEGIIHVIPKLSVLEFLTQNYQISCQEDSSEIQFFWNGDIQHKMFMNGYLGPNVQTVLDNYIDLIQRVR